jgi:hypothetical protein
MRTLLPAIKHVLKYVILYGIHKLGIDSFPMRETLMESNAGNCNLKKVGGWKDRCVNSYGK